MVSTCTEFSKHTVLKEGFRSAVERHLTGKETEPWELISFRLYKSQPPVVESALEVAGMTLGTDKSRGYCLEMNCADFLAGLTSLPRNPKPRGFNDSSVETAADQLNSQAGVLTIWPRLISEMSAAMRGDRP